MPEKLSGVRRKDQGFCAVRGFQEGQLIDFYLIFVPFGHYDEPEILRYANPSICPIGADVRQTRPNWDRRTAVCEFGQRQVPGRACPPIAHRWVPFEGSRVAMKTPLGSPWTRRHFLPRHERFRWQAGKSNRRFRKTPCLLRGEKRVAGGGEEFVDGRYEINRRDRLCRPVRLPLTQPGDRTRRAGHRCARGRSNSLWNPVSVRSAWTMRHDSIFCAYSATTPALAGSSARLTLSLGSPSMS